MFIARFPNGRYLGKVLTITIADMDELFADRGDGPEIQSRDIVGFPTYRDEKGRLWPTPMPGITVSEEELH